MAKIDAPVLRSVITDDEFGGFRISLSPTKRTRIACSIAVLIWVCSILLTLRYMTNSSGSLSFQSLKPLGFLLCIAPFLWFIGGESMLDEILIIADGKSLELRKEFAGFRKVRTFDLASVRNLRPNRANGDPHRHEAPDSLAFEHKGRMYRFGINLSEQEVLRLVKTIRTKVQIRDDWAEVEPLPVLN